MSARAYRDRQKQLRHALAELRRYARYPEHVSLVEGELRFLRRELRLAWAEAEKARRAA
jgi:hypothetical protein